MKCIDKTRTNVLKILPEICSNRKFLNCRRKIRKALLLVFAVASFSLTGCSEEISIENPYAVFSTAEKYELPEEVDVPTISFFAKDLCVAGTGDIKESGITEGLSEAAGIFNTKELTVDYAKNIHEKLYPASTTKILTAYVALKYGNMSDIATVRAEALDLEEGSSVCGLAAGDQISLEELLYGLMMSSGNDAANVIAELISSNTESFAELMNKEALALGALNSHFVNAHGLHDEQHYTTLYDLYLIFQAAIQNETFVKLIHTATHTANFKNSSGEEVVKEWSTTNKYLSKAVPTPDGVTVIGGKTGTTNAAGHCLVLLSKNQDMAPYISIVLKSDGRDNLYLQMSELLEGISK
ncbi:serine hydrolase [Lachnospiraceae bacterium ZAX-1]